MHARPGEVEALVGGDDPARRAVRDAHAQRGDGLFASLDEAIATVRAAGDGRAAPGLAPQVRRARRVGPRRRGGRACSRRARADGVDVAADQYPYTAAATTLTTILPPALLGLGVDSCVAALADLEVRALVRAEIDRGISGWEDVASDPGWGWHPDLATPRATPTGPGRP